MMRSLAIVLLLAGSAAADSKTACVFVTDPANNNNVPFERATKLSTPQTERESEYAVIERGSYGGATFYLRHGNGVVRLEAWSGKNRLAHAMTFYPSGRDPAHTDYLSLEVKTSAGYVEASCYDVVKIHKL